MNYFRGKKINLIAIGKEHIEMTKEWINNEEITVHMGSRFPVNLYEQELWYKNVKKDKTKKKLIINNKEENIGMISIFNIDYKNQNSEIGAYIIPSQQNKGYAKEAIKMMLEYSFYELNMHKIYALIYKSNILSLKLFKSTGFQYESNNKDAIYFQGRFIDIEKYSVFKKDFIEWKK